jgi:hypothetical protein
VIINTRWNVVAKGGLVLPILSLYTQQDAFTQSKGSYHISCTFFIILVMDHNDFIAGSDSIIMEMRWVHGPLGRIRGLSPRSNYTDRATAACHRSQCQLLRIEGATWSA